MGRFLPLIPAHSLWILILFGTFLNAFVYAADVPGSAPSGGSGGVKSEIRLGYGTMNGSRTNSMQGSTAYSLGVNAICCTDKSLHPFLGTEFTSTSSTAYINSRNHSAQDYAIAMNLGLSFRPGGRNSLSPVARASADIGFHNLSATYGGVTNSYTGVIYGGTAGLGIQSPFGSRTLVFLLEYKVRYATSTPSHKFNLGGYFFTLGLIF